MASVVDICNYALSKVGDNKIVAIDEGTPEANQCEILYPRARDFVLRNHPWNCAIGRSLLASSITAPAWGFEKAYPLPADCLRVLDVVDASEWRVEGNHILTDFDGALKVRYVKRIEDTEQFDAHVVEVISSFLAIELAESLTQSNTKKQILLEQHKSLMALAKRSDAQEDYPAKIADDTWLQSRR